jgi:hypothetical protein
MYIDEQWLYNNYACEDGIMWFYANHPNGAEHYVIYNELPCQDWKYWLLASMCGAEIAIRCALKVCNNTIFEEWANNWLSSLDRSSNSAELVAKIVTKYSVTEYTIEDAMLWAAKSASWLAEVFERETSAKWAVKSAKLMVVSTAIKSIKSTIYIDDTIDLLVVSSQCMIK